MVINMGGKSKQYVKIVDTYGYQYASRITGKRGAVVVVPIYRDYETQELKLQLILSERPTFDKPILEFPAGLLDDDSLSIEDTVLKELREETGWTGEIHSVLDPAPSSAGITDEILYIATVFLTEKHEPSHQGNEKIKVLPLMSFVDFIKYINEEDGKILVSSRLVTYMLGFTIGYSFSKFGLMEF